LHINQQRIDQFDGVVMLLLALSRSAVEVDVSFWQLLTADQCVEQQWRSTVLLLSHDNWTVNTLTCWLAALWVTRHRQNMAQFLVQQFVNVRFLQGVTDRIGSVSIFRNVALTLTVDRHISLSWHNLIPVDFSHFNK